MEKRGRGSVMQGTEHVSKISRRRIKSTKYFNQSNRRVKHLCSGSAPSALQGWMAHRQLSFCAQAFEMWTDCGTAIRMLWLFGIPLTKHLAAQYNRARVNAQG
jgi:hypothetical protein